MGEIIRGITKEKNARFICVDSTDIVSEAQKIHSASATVIAALGRLLTVGVMMSLDLKSESDALTLKIDSQGALKQLLVTAKKGGKVKGYVSNPLVDLPLSAKGKLDVGGIIGAGDLRVIKDMGLKEPYVGVNPLVTGEIGDDFSAYFYYSEQIPSIVGVGVLVNPDLSIRKAGGFIIQLLPDAKEDFIDKLESKSKTLKSVTEMLEAGLDTQGIISAVFENIEEYEILEKQTSEYYCDCEKDKFYAGLITLGKEELEDIFNKQEKLETECHFCMKKYEFTKEDFSDMFSG